MELHVVSMPATINRFVIPTTTSGVIFAAGLILHALIFGLDSLREKVPPIVVEIGIALSALVLGVMVLGEIEPPLLVTALIVGTFAIFHGHAHGAELTEGASGVTYSLGFVIATGLLHAAGIAFGLILAGLAAAQFGGQNQQLRNCSEAVHKAI